MSNVMLCKIGSQKDLGKKDYIFEPKFDGIRVLIHKKPGKITLVNRNGNNINKKYPELLKIGQSIKNNSVIDGELVVLNKKHRPDFSLLQQRDHLTKEHEIDIRSREFPATIFVFDILELNRKNTKSLPLSERKKILKKQIKNSSKISFTPFTREGKKLWKKIQKLKFEGVIAKKADSKYELKRSSNWLKIKNEKTIDAVIVGYTQQKRKISSLALGAYHNGKFIYIGKVNFGKEKLINELARKLKRTKKPAVELSSRIIPVKPKIIVEIKYLEITKDLKLRAPIFLKFRTDKPKKECTI